MITKAKTSLRLGGKTYNMRPGRSVPAAVLAYWRKTGQIDGLKKAGIIEDENSGSKKTVEEMVEEPADGAGSVRKGKSG